MLIRGIELLFESEYEINGLCLNINGSFNF
jgi:hypothetical protein